MKVLGRFSIPHGWEKEKKHAPIYGEIFWELDEAQKILTCDTIYEIREVMGVLMIEEIGPSEMDSRPNPPKDRPRGRGNVYGWLAEDVLTGTEGSYVLTQDEFAVVKRREKE